MGRRRDLGLRTRLSSSAVTRRKPGFRLVVHGHRIIQDCDMFASSAGGRTPGGGAAPPHLVVRRCRCVPSSGEAARPRPAPSGWPRSRSCGRRRRWPGPPGPIGPRRRTGSSVSTAEASATSRPISASLRAMAPVSRQDRRSTRRPARPGRGSGSPIDSSTPGLVGDRHLARAQATSSVGLPSRRSSPTGLPKRSASPRSPSASSRSWKAWPRGRPNRSSWSSQLGAGSGRPPPPRSGAGRTMV